MLTLLARGWMSATLVLGLALLPRAVRSEPLEWTTTYSLRPPARSSFVAGFDHVGNRYLVYSGYPWFPDLWALSAGEDPAWGLVDNLQQPRSHCLYAPDPAGNRLLVFGGQWDGHSVGGFRILDLATGAWSAPPPVSGDIPDANYAISRCVAYDATRNQFVILGSQIAGNSYVLNLATGVWTAMTNTGAVSYDSGSAVYDPVRDRYIINTTDGLCQVTPDTFTWSVITPDPGPGYLVYDAARDRLLAVAGGEVRAMSLDDPPVWTAISPTPAPPVPSTGLAFDTVGDRLVVHAGSGASTWAFSLATNTWSAIMPDLPPSETRYDHTSVLVRPWNAIVNYGSQFTLTAPVSKFGLGAPGFEAVSPGGAAPGARQAHAAIHDPIRGRMIVFGGHNGSGGYYNDVQAMYTGATMIWTQLLPLGTLPAKRAGVEALYDPVRDRMLVFGGYDGTVPSYRDLWSLSLPAPPTKPTWTLLFDNGAPEQIPALVPGSAAIVHDSRRDRVIVLGTEQATSLLRAWACPLAGPPAWTQLAGSSTERVAFDAAYDSLNDRVLLFGGKDIAGTTITNDLTALSFPSETWGSLPVPNGPPGRYAHTFVHDAANGRFIVLGGRESTSNPTTVWYLNDRGAQVLDVPPRPVAGGFGLAACRLVAPDRVRVSAALPETGDVALEVFDLLGRRWGRSLEAVPAPGPRDFTVALDQDASPGLYFVRVVQGARSARGKLVVVY